jgi:hypothetical protein
MLAEAGPPHHGAPAMLSASARHHVIDALDKLISARKKAVKLIVKRFDSNIVDDALDAAIAETKKAGNKLARVHPDSESLPIQEWSAFNELGIIAAAYRVKTPTMSSTQRAEWKLQTIAAVKQHAAQIDRALQRFREKLPEGAPENGVEVVAGGFRYGEKTHSLTGRPLKMLTAILGTKHHRCTRDELRRLIGVDDTAVTWPEQVIIDTAKKLRDALRKAVKDAGLDCQNPLPSTGKGADLSYALSMP